ncbi:hypothetical protein A8V49_19025 [Yersinia pestis]|nr:hypothetical protein A8V49_19025 [Yersinia pestis]PCN71442.1 hypothetical protein A8V24_15610 [Yersinia pestis]
MIWHKWGVWKVGIDFAAYFIMNSFITNRFSMDRSLESLAWILR